MQIWSAKTSCLWTVALWMDLKPGNDRCPDQRQDVSTWASSLPGGNTEHQRAECLARITHQLGSHRLGLKSSCPPRLPHESFPQLTTFLSKQ